MTAAVVHSQQQCPGTLHFGSRPHLMNIQVILGFGNEDNGMCTGKHGMLDDAITYVEAQMNINTSTASGHWQNVR